MRTLTKEQIQNASKLTQPEDSNYKESIIYIKEIQKVMRDGEAVIWVNGAFPNGCTQLFKASHTVENGDTLILSLKGWTPTDRICTQALVPFNYIYDSLDPKTIDQLAHYKINDQLHDF